MYFFCIVPIANESISSFQAFSHLPLAVSIFEDCQAFPKSYHNSGVPHHRAKAGTQNEHGDSMGKYIFVSTCLAFKSLHIQSREQSALRSDPTLQAHQPSREMESSRSRSLSNCRNSRTLKATRFTDITMTRRFLRIKQPLRRMIWQSREGTLNDQRFGSYCYGGNSILTVSSAEDLTRWEANQSEMPLYVCLIF